jgi:hypothetical protein
MDVEYITSNEPGRWRQDPIGQIPIAMGAYWGKATPFVLRSSDQFRVPPPPTTPHTPGPPEKDSEWTAPLLGESLKKGKGRFYLLSRWLVFDENV